MSAGADTLESLIARLRAAAPTLESIGPLGDGVSQRETVWREDRARLLRITAPDTGCAAGTPLVIVFALVNRWYVIDLDEERSLVRALREGGREVYVIDWGEPLPGDRWLRMEDYIDGYLGRCVDKVCERHGVDRVDLLGICQGGTFSLCYTARHPGRVRRLVTMVTPVDFDTPGNRLAAWARAVDVDLLIDTLGNVPGALLNAAFVGLQPFRLLGGKALDYLETVEDRDRLRRFLRMERWIHDSPDQAGETFRQFVVELFRENRLARGTFTLGGETVDLGRIRMPVLNVYAAGDHLVPPAASAALASRVGSADYTEHVFAGGHIGIYVSARAREEIPPLLLRWLGEEEKETAPPRRRAKQKTARRRVSPRRP